jgi:hypothetical protein
VRDRRRPKNSPNHELKIVGKKVKQYFLRPTHKTNLFLNYRYIIRDLKRTTLRFITIFEQK